MANLKFVGSRKLSKLKSSRRLLFKGVPVIRIRCTVLSVFSRLKIRLPSDLTEEISFVHNKASTSLRL
jgi:hypothetical protein